MRKTEKHSLNPQEAPHPPPEKKKVLYFINPTINELSVISESAYWGVEPPDR